MDSTGTGTAGAGPQCAPESLAPTAEVVSTAGIVRNIKAKARMARYLGLYLVANPQEASWNPKPHDSKDSERR